MPIKSLPAGENAQRLAFQRSGHKPILYRVLTASATIALFIFAGFRATAQDSAPEIKPQERRFDKKKDQGPRAIALVNLASNGKATLVPIAIRVDGKFYDAASYKATPVPMALDSGTVYEVERTGKSLGLFTVSAALHSNAVNAVTPWIGTGLWLPEGTEAPKSGRKAESVPVGIENSDAPPRLAKSGSQNNNSKEAAAPTAQTPPAAATPESKPSSESKPSTTSQAGSDSGSASKADAATQTEHNPPVDDSNSSTDASNRPRLRRGRPTGPLPSDDEVPGYSRPGSSASAAKNSDQSASKSAPAAAPNDTTQLVPAVSDADGPNPRSFAFEWPNGEEADRRKQLLDLAREQVRLYLAKQAKASIAATASAPKTAAHRPAPKTAEPVLDNVEMRTFDLWVNNQPIMILTAAAHLPPPAARSGAAPAADSLAQYTITLAARTDIYDNLHKLYSGVTDKYHLDVTPRLELIDAVDADGDGRGELLFRETSDAGNGYIIYRATADTLWKMFDSLNPE